MDPIPLVVALSGAFRRSSCDQAAGTSERALSVCGRLVPTRVCAEGSILTEKHERETTEGEAQRLRKDLGGGAWVGTVAGEVPCFAADRGRPCGQGSGSKAAEALEQCILELGIGGIRRDGTLI